MMPTPSAAGAMTPRYLMKSESPEGNSGVHYTLGNFSAPLLGKDAVDEKSPTLEAASASADESSIVDATVAAGVGVVAKGKKSRRKLSVNDEKPLISTSSPEGIAAASQITPNRIANILLKQGPLPIRHLTAHLIEQVPSFGSLSLSKQRRLIMASLESGDLITGAVFEKIGWGQWEARVVSLEIVKAKIEKGASSNAIKSESNTEDKLNDSAIETKPRFKTRYSVSHSSASRRESITAPQNEHNFKVPISPSLLPIQNLRNNMSNFNGLDEAIESSSESEDDEDNEGGHHDHFHEYRLNKSSPTAEEYSYARTLHPRTSSSSLVKQPNIRSSSISSSRRPSFAGIVKAISNRKPRTSFTQHSIEVKLDESVPGMERRESRVSFSNVSALSRQSFLRTNISPPTDADENENENAIVDDDDNPYTDEEDWESMGAITMRKAISSNFTPPTPNFDGSGPAPGPNAMKTDEELAAIALMDLKTV